MSKVQAKSQGVYLGLEVAIWEPFWARSKYFSPTLNPNPKPYTLRLHVGTVLNIGAQCKYALSIGLKPLIYRLRAPAIIQNPKHQTLILMMGTPEKSPPIFGELPHGLSGIGMLAQQFGSMAWSKVDNVFYRSFTGCRV